MPTQVGTGSIRFAAVHPSGRFLYITTDRHSDYDGEWGDYRIYGFQIDAASGALAPTPGSPYTVQHGPYVLAVSDLSITADSKFLVANCSTTLCVYRIDQEDGRLIEAELFPLDPEDDSFSRLTAHPKRPLLFAFTAPIFDAPARITSWSLDKNGLASKVCEITASTHIWRLLADPSGAYLYAYIPEVSEPKGALISYRIGADGCLEEVPNGRTFVAPEQGCTCALNLFFHPSGTFLYIQTNPPRGQHAILGFKVTDGTFSPASWSPVALPDTLSNLAIDASGRQMFIGNRGTSPLVFLVDPGTGEPKAAPSNPPAQSGAWDLIFPVTIPNN